MSSLTSYLHTKLNTVISLTSLLSVLIALLSGLLADAKVIATALVIVGTLGLLFSNIWVHVAPRQPSPLLVSTRVARARYRISTRILTNAASLIFGAAAWIMIAMMFSPQLHGLMLYELGNCQRAIRKLESFHTVSPGTLRSHLALATCYDRTSRLLDHVTVIEHMIQNGHFLNQLGADQRTSTYGDLGATYLSQDYMSEYAVLHGQSCEHCVVRAVDYLTIATSTPRPRFTDHWFLAVAKAADRRVADKEQRLKSVEFHFAKSRELIAKVPADTNERREVEALQLFWYGKALVIVDDLDGACDAFVKGLAWVPEGSVVHNRLLIELATYGPSEYLVRLKNTENIAETIVLLAMEAYTKAAALRGRPEFSEKLQHLDLLIDKLGELRTSEDYYFQGEFLRAAAAELRGDIAGGLAHARQALRIRPDSPALLQLVIRALNASERPNEALLYAQTLVKSAPQEANSHYYLGMAAARNGSYASANAALKEAIRLDSKKPEYYLWAAMSAQGFASEAENSVQGSERALGFIRTGIRVASAQGDSSNKKELEALLPDVLNDLAQKYAQQSRELQLARSYIDEALKYRPSHPHYMDTKAWILITTSKKAGRRGGPHLHEAERLLLRTLELLDSESVDARSKTLYHLAYLKHYMGDSIAARQFALQILDQHPHDEKAKELLGERGD